MQMPAQSWPMIYSASRRKHNHRCVVCARIVKDGEAVIMVRVDVKRTKVVHTDPCSTVEHSPGRSYAEAFRLWGIERNAGLGYREAKQIVATDPFFRAN